MKEKRNIYTAIFIFFVISIMNLINADKLNLLYKYYFVKQIIWYGVSIIILIILNKIKINKFFKYSKYFYFFNLILLGLVLIFGKTINGAKAWFNIGMFSVQPSEFMKIALTLYLIEIVRSKDKKLLKVIKMCVITFIPCLLVFLEPDTGAIIFYIIIFFTMLFLLKIKWQYYLLFFISGLFFISLFIYFYFHNQDSLIKVLGTSIFYRADRFINFKSNNYQLDLSLISVFSGPIVRNGFRNILLYIPEGATDFIFAFTIGNFGLILAPIILLNYLFLIVNLLNLLKKSQDKKTNYLIISFTYMLLVQIIINISMNIGLLPIVGITLPFLSYGGSSLLVIFIFLGIIFSLVTKKTN